MTIVGRVNASHEAIISLHVGGFGNRHRIDAVVDTVFNGFLTLPARLVQELDLVWRRRGRAMLADGTDSLFDIYEATVMWHGRPRRIAVDEVDCDPLVGMSLLDGCKLTVDVVHGGRVVIRPLPPREPGNAPSATGNLNSRSVQGVRGALGGPDGNDDEP